MLTTRKEDDIRDINTNDWVYKKKMVIWLNKQHFDNDYTGKRLYEIVKDGTKQKVNTI